MSVRSAGAAAQFASSSPFVAERSIYWGHGRVEGTNTVGVNTTSGEWNLPEGVAGGNFETFLLLGNPWGVPSVVDLSLQIEGYGQVTLPPSLRKTVPAAGRLTLYMPQVLRELEQAEGVPLGTFANVVVRDHGPGALGHPGDRRRARHLLAARRHRLLARRQRRLRDGAIVTGGVRGSTALTWILAAALVGAAAPQAAAQAAQPAQSPTKPKPSAPRTPPRASGAAATPADRDARLARSTLERGDAAKAIAIADTVLAKEAGHPLAAATKVEALLGLGERTQALDAYDAWYRVVRLDDVRLLGRIASAELTALEKEPLLEIDVLAARAAGSGADATKARARLVDLAWATPQTAKSWPAIAALGRRGDRKAAERAAQAYRESAGSGRIAALGAVIESGGPGAEAILREALGIRDAMVQSAAADGAATLKLKALVPDLQRVAKDGELFAKFAAAVALAQLGATGGEALVEAAATSPAMDARLKAVVARKARGDRALDRRRQGAPREPGRGGALSGGGAALERRSCRGNAGTAGGHAGPEPSRPRAGGRPRHARPEHAGRRAPAAPARRHPPRPLPRRVRDPQAAAPARVDARLPE